MESQNTQMHCRISPRRTCNSCGFTIFISSSYHRLLSNNVKRDSKIDGMGPFNGQVHPQMPPMAVSCKPNVADFFEGNILNLR